ncbi:MAG: hypothetical protein Tsb005_01300 [Gammaproteobacteria bacterium]
MRKDKLHNPLVQRGFINIGVLFNICMVGVLVLAGLRLLPIYYQHFQVQTVMKNIQQEFSGRTEVPAILSEKVLDSMRKRLDVNDLHDIKRNNMIVEATSRGVLLRVNYVTQTNFLGNIKFLITFDKTVEIGRNVTR